MKMMASINVLEKTTLHQTEKWKQKHFVPPEKQTSSYENISSVNQYNVMIFQDLETTEDRVTVIMSLRSCGDLLEADAIGSNITLILRYEIFCPSTSYGWRYHFGFLQVYSVL